MGRITWGGVKVLVPSLMLQEGAQFRTEACECATTVGAIRELTVLSIAMAIRVALAAHATVVPQCVCLLPILIPLVDVRAGEMNKHRPLLPLREELLEVRPPH